MRNVGIIGMRSGFYSSRGKQGFTQRSFQQGPWGILERMILQAGTGARLIPDIRMDVKNSKACTHGYRYTHSHTHTHTHTHIYKYIHTHKHTYILHITQYTNTCTYITHIHKYMHTHVTHIHKYMHTHITLTHTSHSHTSQTHTNTCTCVCMCTSTQACIHIQDGSILTPQMSGSR